MRFIWIASFAFLAISVHLRWLAPLDEAALRFLAVWRPSGTAEAMNWLFRLGFAPVDAVIAVVWSGLLLLRRQPRNYALLPLLIFPLIGLEATLRIIIDQPGPGTAYALPRSFARDPVSYVLDNTDATARKTFVEETAPAPTAKVAVVEEQPHTFPSGHSSRSLLLALLAADQFRSWKRDRFEHWLWIPAILSYSLAGLVGFSALYFGYHWPSDVVGGYLLAMMLYQVAVWIRSGTWLAVRFDKLQGA